MGREVESIDEIERWVSDSETLFPTTATTSTSKLPLLLLNHVSFVVKSVATTVRFYEEVLGFVLIKRPSSFDFEGAWLFNYGIGIHLLESEEAPMEKKGVINPKENHISFQTTDMQLIMRKLEGMNIEYVTAVVKEGGIKVDQLFFHDPDGYMIEICNCHVLPVLPLSTCPINKLPSRSQSLPQPASYDKWNSSMYCSAFEARMMENLAVGMMDLSF